MLVGEILQNRYYISKKLGNGNFGDTYLAEDRQLPGNPPCVVKHLKPNNPKIIDVAKRLFAREAKTLYNLGRESDRIPTLFAYFEEGEEFYLVQEYIEGHDLMEELTQGKRFGESDVIALLQGILEVLAVAHRDNVIHRDIKPQNLMRRRQDGKIVLIDFGAVKEVSSLVLNAQGETSSTIAIGTHGYMPTEQASGEPKLSSDIYAVGMLGIQALTGVLPNQLSKDPRTGEVVWRDRVSVTDELADILTRMVRYDFRQRYSNAAEALSALASLSGEPGNLLPEEPGVSPPSAQHSTSKTQAANRPWWQILWLAIFGGIVIAGAVLTGHYYWQTKIMRKGSEAWYNGINTAISAANKTQIAQTKADWTQVVREWQNAINLMKKVPESHPNYQTAQQKLQEYQRYLNHAKEMPEIWHNAINTAISAANKTQTANTKADWAQVVSEWEKAINLMEEVPESHPNYQTAQQKLQEYQRYLNHAKEEENRAFY